MTGFLHQRVCDEDGRALAGCQIQAVRWVGIDHLVMFTQHETKDFYPEMPDYGGFVDPPYEISDHPVRGGGGWAIILAYDLARYGWLVVTGGIWKGERLLNFEWVQGHGGGSGSGVQADGDKMMSIAIVTAQGLPSLADLGDTLADSTKQGRY